MRNGALRARKVAVVVRLVHGIAGAVDGSDFDDDVRVGDCDGPVVARHGKGVFRVVRRIGGASITRESEGGEG